MNSEPSLKNTGTVAIIMTRAVTSTNHFQRRAHSATGRYTAISMRLSGCFSSAMDGPDKDGIGCPAKPARAKFKAPQSGKRQTQGRAQGDCQKCGNKHGERLGVGQRFKKTAFFCFKGQYRQERNGNHQQREKARSGNLFDGMDHYRPIVFLAVTLVAILPAFYAFARPPR